MDDHIALDEMREGCGSGGRVPASDDAKLNDRAVLVRPAHCGHLIAVSL
jgi:hypothetical protein